MDGFGSLNAFVQAAETRSFTQAGRRLGLSSSAIGKMVARLEEEMGVRLFHRSTRAITLTDEGGLFLERCHRILAEIEVARAELTQAAGTPRGRLRVGLPQVGMALASHFIAFQQAYPEIELELEFSDRLVNVIEEGFDAVMRIGEIDDSRLTMRRLAGYRHQLVAAPAYLAARGCPAVPAELAGHACLRYRYPSSGKLAPWPLVTAGVPVPMELPETAISNTIDALQLMAEAGLGIALLPDFVIGRALAEGRLVELMSGHVEDRRSFCILWPASRQPLPRIRAFVEFMVARLGEGTGLG